MVDIKKLFITVLIGTTLFGCSNSFNNKESGVLKESTYDTLNNVTGKTLVRGVKVGNDEEIGYSKTYVQYGKNSSNNYVIRFATAVKGEIESLVYTRASIEGIQNSSGKNVRTIYRSITADNNTWYYDGTNLTTDDSYAGKYYWACYSIEFTTDEYYETKISVNLKINDEILLDTKTASLSDLCNSTLWTVKPTFNEDTSGRHGSLYLDTTTYNIHQFQNDNWKLVDNISSEVENNANPTIDIDDKGFWTVNGTPLVYKAYTRSNVLEYLTKEDYFRQVAMYGVVSNQTNKTRTRVVFSIKMQAGTIVSFLDTTKYVYGVQETEKVGTTATLVNTSWLTDKTSYTTVNDSFIQVMIKKSDETEFTADELKNTHSLIKVTGIKESLSYSTSFDDYEFENQIVHYGYPANPVSRKYVRISFSIPTERNSVIKFIGDSSKYDWTVQEVDNTSGSSYIFYDGWASKWADPTTYTTKLDDGFIVLVLKLVSGSNFGNAAYDLLNANIHSLFDISGVKKKTDIQVTIKNNLRLGDAAKYALENGETLTLGSAQVGTQGKIFGDVSMTKTLYGGQDECTVTHDRFYMAKGGCTDGRYFYTGLNANGGTNAGYDVGVIAKFDLDGNLLATTENSYLWGNSVRLSYYNGDIYVARTNATTTTYENATIFNGVVLKFNSNLELVDENFVLTNVEIPENGIIEYIDTNTDGSRLFVVYRVDDNNTNRLLYIYDKNVNGELVTVYKDIQVGSINDDKQLNGFDVVDKYIYCIYSETGFVRIGIFDHNGEKIYESIIDKPAEGFAKLNFQSIVEIEGKEYYSISNWGEYSGLGLYELTHKYTNLYIDVNFDSNGPNIQYDTQVLRNGSLITKPVDPTYSYIDINGKNYNFVFDGWYYGSERWDFESDTVKNNMTLVAKWSLDESFYEIDENAGIRTDGTKARIMSFNVLTEYYNKIALTDEYRLGCAFDTIKRYSPDVIGVQEFDEKWYDYYTSTEGYAVVNADNIYIKGTTVNYSTLIYNTKTVKLVEYQQVQLATRDNSKCRNVTTGVFEFITGENVGEQFIVCSTHWNLTETTRVTQALEMSAILDAWETKYPDLPIAATGDFNADDSTESIKTFVAESSYIDAKNADKIGIICKATHGYKYYGSNQYTFEPMHLMSTNTIDHIFVSPNSEPLYYTAIVDVDALNASDHCPIICDFAW